MPLQNESVQPERVIQLPNAVNRSAELQVVQYASQHKDSTHAPAMEWFIETLTALIMQYEEEIERDPTSSPAGVLQSLMEVHNLRQVDLLPVLGSKSYVSQILSGHRPIGKEAAAKLAEFFQVKAQTFF